MTQLEKLTRDINEIRKQLLSLATRQGNRASENGNNISNVSSKADSTEVRVTDAEENIDINSECIDEVAVELNNIDETSITVSECLDELMEILTDLVERIENFERS